MTYSVDLRTVEQKQDSYYKEDTQKPNLQERMFKMEGDDTTTKSMDINFVFDFTHNKNYLAD